MMCLLTQNRYASYTVSVRQYRILQSRFLQCMPHDKPPCDLLILRATNPRIRDFHPLEKLHLPKALFNQNYLYLWIFSIAFQQVRAAHAGRTHCIRAIAGEVVNRRSVLLINCVLNGQESASNPLLHIHANRCG